MGQARPDRAVEIPRTREIAGSRTRLIAVSLILHYRRLRNPCWYGVVCIVQGDLSFLVIDLSYIPLQADRFVARRVLDYGETIGCEIEA